MKTLAIIALAISAGFSASSAEPAKGFEALITELPRHEVLKAHRDLLKGDQGKAATRATKRAKAGLDRAKVIIPKIRAAIKVGSSIFDYPGLLAHNRPNYSKFNEVDGKDIGPGYSLYVGIYLLDHEGREPYDFRVVFDMAGTVRAVEGVTWKS